MPSVLPALPAPPAKAVVPAANVAKAPDLHLPEVGSGRTAKYGWTARKYLIAAAHPLAVEAGYRMLSQGGSAVDAAIAAQMVLTLVEPQSSGLGGGAFMLHFDGNAVRAFDGRETAPAGVTETLFQRPGGKQTYSFYEAVIGGRSTGVPGVLRMLQEAHRRYGKLPWATLFKPAVELAENGFAVSPRLHTLIASDPYLKNDPVAAAYFYDSQGLARPVGWILRNPTLAKTLREIAVNGPDAFYKGRIAADIVAKVKQHPTNPGFLSAADMAGYQAKVRDPVCEDYKQWTVCGMPPPSSAGVAIGQMLGILEHTDIGHYPPHDGALDPQGVHLFSEAGRLAYADRAHYVADTDFSPLPLTGGNNGTGGIAALLDHDYLAQRATLIGSKSMGSAPYGKPFGDKLALSDDTALEFAGTSHLSIVDGYGNALAMTTSIEDAFGSRQMVDGFMLNNQLTDFSFDPTDGNGPAANRVQPGKRPRSSMAPTLVFEKGSKKMVLSVGSPGGSAIINYVAKVLVGMMDWGLNLQQAIDLPNIGSRNGPTELEQGTAGEEDLAKALKAKGHEVRVMEQPSGLQGIMRLSIHGDDLWFAGADPRREGSARGD